MDKAEFLRWSRKYDKDHSLQFQKEQELGARFRRNKSFTREDLLQIVDWKFGDNEQKRTRTTEAVAKNDEAIVARISSQVFNVTETEDAFRMNSLTMLGGVSPILASVILSFFDPKQYGIFDVRVWRELLGNEPPNLFSTQNYLKFLTSLRKTANKNNLDARTIEKALFEKNLEKS